MGEASDGCDVDLCCGGRNCTVLCSDALWHRSAGGTSRSRRLTDALALEGGFHGVVDAGFGQVAMLRL